jgi:hypothetical protein
MEPYCRSGWLHVDRRTPAWGRQYRDLGFSRAEQAAATQAFGDWRRRMMEMPPTSDCAADVLEPNGAWNAYLQAMSGFLTGAGLERISVADYIAYEAASTGYNWRAPAGYGSLVAASLPRPIDLRLSTPVESIELDPWGVVLATPVGAIRACCDRHGLDGCPGHGPYFRVGSTLGGTPRRACPLGAMKNFFWRLPAIVRLSLRHAYSGTPAIPAPASITSARLAGLSSSVFSAIREPGWSKTPVQRPASRMRSISLSRYLDRP